jgi:hypothetical protein
MKTQLFKSAYVEYLFEANTGIFHEIWSDKSINEFIYKDEIVRKKNLIDKYTPKYILDDISKTDFTITPELQEWTSNILGPILTEIGLEKYAIIMPKQLFAQVSMEQTIDEVSDHNVVPFTLQLFEDKNAALDWLSEETVIK